jgi:hypothetical protein
MVISMGIQVEKICPTCMEIAWHSDALPSPLIKLWNKNRLPYKLRHFSSFWTFLSQRICRIFFVKIRWGGGYHTPLSWNTYVVFTKHPTGQIKQCLYVAYLHFVPIHEKQNFLGCQKFSTAWYDSSALVWVSGDIFLISFTRHVLLTIAFNLSYASVPKIKIILLWTLCPTNQVKLL